MDQKFGVTCLNRFQGLGLSNALRDVGPLFMIRQHRATCETHLRCILFGKIFDVANWIASRALPLAAHWHDPKAVVTEISTDHGHTWQRISPGVE